MTSHPRSRTVPARHRDGEAIGVEAAGCPGGRGGGAGRGIGGGGAGGLTGGVGDEHHVPAQQADLQDHQQEQHEEREQQGQLDRCLPALVLPRRRAPRARSRDLVEDPVDHAVEQAGDLVGLGGPGDEEQGDAGRAEQHEGVLGGRLAPVVGEAPAEPIARARARGPGGTRGSGAWRTSIGWLELEGQRLERRGEQGDDGEQREGRAARR